MKDNELLSLGVLIAECFPGAFDDRDFEKLSAAAHAFTVDDAELRRRVMHLSRTRREPPTAEQLIHVLSRPESAADAWRRINQILDSLDVTTRRQIRRDAINALATELPAFARDLRAASHESVLVKQKMVEILNAGTPADAVREKFAGSP